MKKLNSIKLATLLLFSIPIFLLSSCFKQVSISYNDIVLNTQDTINLPSNFIKIDSNFVFKHEDKEYEVFINEVIDVNLDKSIYHKSTILKNSQRNDHFILLIRTSKIQPSNDLINMEKNGISEFGERKNFATKFVSSKVVTGDLDYIKIETEFSNKSKFTGVSYSVMLEDQGCRVIEYYKKSNKGFEGNLKEIKMSKANKMKWMLNN